MKKFMLPYLAIVLSVVSLPAFSQSTGSDTAMLGLPGDNLDLYAVLDLFQKSKTIEAFEKSLNEQKTGINNLDLDLDKKVDFIKVVTKQKDSSFTFILQVEVSKTEKQDVAVIMLEKKKGKVTMQIVGDEDLYGKNYIVEPKSSGTPSVTANPGYTGPEPVTVNVPATTVVVETTPIVQYVYSPVYVPYVPPYHYGYYPPYFAAFTVMAVGIYHANHYHYHGGYGYHNTTVIHNHNTFNNYNGNRNRSDRVAHNNANGRYNNGNRASDRQGNRGSDRGSNRGSDRPSASTRPSTGQSDRRSGGASVSDRQSRSNFSSPSTMQSGRSRGGGGGGGRGGGGARGGGGRRR
ncbi:hypothetical protein [Flavihumibacter solisilvae]|uniref:DUF3300 domain-containing protein n=1 Tax=Flavihumibacter solisilvae TaxID=1349421 RepID=A0A0C1IU24_9BACT|nr:hypothetical protein [Flavihumibacter solisilvae]KIC93954.1 hypothetical protein OI18_12960 [Flavihumibacter solisilvae]